MAIRFECPECGKTLSVQDQFSGKKVKCPCGAVVVANAAGAAPTAAPRRPVPAQMKSTAAAKPTSAAKLTNAGAGSSVRGGAAQPQSRPLAPNARGPAGNSDLADLFNELTPTDLETRAQRTEAAANAPEKIDPLAAYRPVDTGRRGRGSTGPAIERPLGLKILAGLAVLGIIGSLVGAGLAFASPETLQRGPEPLAANVIKLTGGLLIGSAIVWMVIVSALLTPQPWAWWFCNLAYSSNIWFNLLNSFAEGQAGNVPRAVGRTVGGLIVGAIILSYLSKQSTRDFFSVKVPVWVGPVVGIPAGFAIAFAVVLGIAAAVLAVSL